VKKSSGPATTSSPNGSLTTTSFALLGLLNVKAWTTYELAKQVQRSLGWFWPRTERKLYDEPKRLVAAGLATATEQHTGKRARTVYAINGAGRKALRSWLGEPSASPSLEFEGMVKVFFADGATLAELRATIRAIEDAATQRRDELRAMIEASRSGPYEFAGRLPINALALRFQLDHEAVQIRWAQWACLQISDWNSTTDANGWDVVAALDDPA
jgi:PadR family transcriptional regulator, regulatory protein AphA